MERMKRVGSSKQPRLIWFVSLLSVVISAGVAFAAPQYGLNCASCHGMPPIDSATRNVNTGGFVGNHQNHQSGTPSIATCAVCHNASGYTNSHTNGQISFKKTMNASPKAGATYTSSGLTDAGTYTFKNQTTVPSLGTCSNVNCHFESTTLTWGSPALTYTSSTVNDCNDCHGMPPVGTSPNFTGGAAGSHVKHDTYYAGAANCVKCHADHVVEPNKFSHASSAGNRNLIVAIKDPANVAGGSLLRRRQRLPAEPDQHLRQLLKPLLPL